MPATKTPGKATIIWRQIPLGVRMRLGARQPVGDEVKGYLHFTVGPARHDLFKVTIQLDPSDTYTVRLVRVNARTLETTTLEEAADVYADMLGELLVAWEGRHLIS